MGFLFGLAVVAGGLAAIIVLYALWWYFFSYSKVVVTVSSEAPEDLKVCSSSPITITHKTGTTNMMMTVLFLKKQSHQKGNPEKVQSSARRMEASDGGARDGDADAGCCGEADAAGGEVQPGAAAAGGRGPGGPGLVPDGARASGPSTRGGCGTCGGRGRRCPSRRRARRSGRSWWCATG